MAQSEASGKARIRGSWTRPTERSAGSARSNVVFPPARGPWTMRTRLCETTTDEMRMIF